MSTSPAAASAQAVAPAKAVALVPAAGLGSRFHDDGPKALVLLAGKPLLLHALERLHASGRVAEAVVAMTPGYESAFRAALARAPLPCRLVPGGVRRRDSVASALDASNVGEETLVLVHDAARPLVDPLEVLAVVDAAAERGAAIAGFAMVNTVKRTKNGKVVETVPRHDLVSVTTPQVFRAGLLRKAYAMSPTADVTDDSELVERAGGTVAVVLTSRWNLKITYPEDLAWAEAFLAGGPPSGAPRTAQAGS
ncbi:MAG TPA: 2-C-methyl-D-erythritol 4-phosphate cytidylyltransferase [Thermoanaerobaculia bacterium]|nr:2-C-methyl-D-erythritol 4-phosphate cytidylyltransferase [Thermoanaerobaculia bacterium]